MSDTQQENIIERSSNAVLYFKLLVLNSQTVKSDIGLTLKAESVLQKMNEFDHIIKNKFSKP